MYSSLGETQISQHPRIEENSQDQRWTSTHKIYTISRIHSPRVLTSKALQNFNTQIVQY